MYPEGRLRKVHLELTDKCNAACPLCPRSDHGGTVNPSLPLTELTLDDVRTILPVELVRGLRHIYVCGNHGDAVMARDTLEIFTYLRAANDGLLLGLNTNGGARPPEWWAALGALLPRDFGYATFGIDGLEDTHALYRRGTNWHTVIRNAKAFIAAGGAAEWDFLVFRHNEHQLGAARRMARDLGFARFRAKWTDRFPGRPPVSVPVKDASGAELSRLEPPTRHETPGAAPRATGISCVAAETRSIYISSEGHVLPCCWIGADLHADGAARAPLSRLLDESGGLDALDARRRPLSAILAEPFFQRSLQYSWRNAPLATCARQCGAGSRHLGGATAALASTAEFVREKNLLPEPAIQALKRRILDLKAGVRDWH